MASESSILFVVVVARNQDLGRPVQISQIERLMESQQWTHYRWLHDIPVELVDMSSWYILPGEGDHEGVRRIQPLKPLQI